MTENERLNNAIIAAIEERDRLRAERDALAALLRNTHDEILSVTCDPEGKVCISGSNGDRKIIQDALAALDTALKDKP